MQPETETRWLKRIAVSLAVPAFLVPAALLMIGTVRYYQHAGWRELCWDFGILCAYLIWMLAWSPDWRARFKRGPNRAQSPDRT